MKVYYLTPSKNVPSILRKGLTAGKGRGLTEYLYKEPVGGFMKEEKSTLYFADDLESMGELIAAMRYLAKGPRLFTILEVDLPDSYLVEPDERRFGGGEGALKGFLRSEVKNIPSSRIKVLGQVKVRPNKESTYQLGPEVVEVLRLGMRSSELADALKEPSSREEESQILGEIRQLPKASRAHQIADEREEMRDFYGGILEGIEKRQERE